MKVYCRIHVLLQWWLLYIWSVLLLCISCFHCSVSQSVKIRLISYLEFLSMSVAFNLTTSMYFLLLCIHFVSLSNSNLCRMFSSNLFLPFKILFMKLILPFIILFFISDDPISLRRVEFGAYCGAFSIVCTHYFLFFVGLLCFLQIV